MRQVFRTVGLVRGTHPYAFISDDVRKDDAAHLYQWVAMLNGGVWQARVDGLAPNQIALAFRPGDPEIGSGDPHPLIDPVAGEPLLLVNAANLANSGQASLPLLVVERCVGPKDRGGKPQFYDRLAISRRAVEAHFRVLFLPMLAGQQAPVVSSSGDRVRVGWPRDQEDDLAFEAGADGRYRITVARNGKTVLVGR